MGRGVAGETTFGDAVCATYLKSAELLIGLVRIDADGQLGRGHFAIVPLHSPLYGESLISYKKCH